jgi:hypothetical protein
MVKRESADIVERDPSYQGWLDSKPAPGEVFVDTGEPSAEDSRKLSWSPSDAQRELARQAVEGEVNRVNDLYRGRGQEAYARRMEGMVAETLREAGVDPATLRPLPDMVTSSGDASNDKIV